MALSPKARPYLLVAALVLAVVAVLVAKTPGETGRPVAVPPTTTPPVVNEVGGDGAGDPYYPQDGNSGYDVSGYDVSISYDPATRHLEGRTQVSAVATADLSRFNLDLYKLEVSEVTLGTEQAEFSREGDHELVITPAKPLRRDEKFVVAVTYAGEPTVVEDRALGRSGWQVSSSGGAFAAGEPHSATTWFPANDTPRDKATFKLAARVPDGWSAVSNGVEDGTTSQDGWTTFRWNAPQPMATYLATVAIDKWTFDRSTLADGTPVVSAYAPGALDARDDHRRLPEVLEFLSGKFGPYPFQAAGGIFIADNIGFSLETQTRPIYAQWADLDTIVHENAHMWFGDSVTLRSWSDICLNECFASYAQWLWDEGKGGANLDDRFRREVDRTRDSDAYWSRKLYDMGRGNEFRGVYDKGQLAVHALRRQVGDESFFKALQGWTAQHRDGNASWPEFEAHVEQVSGQDLDGFFAAWFRGAELPSSDDVLYPGSLRR